MADDLRLTDTQQRILEALCRPCTGETHFAPPATNLEIADELYLSVDAIKAHLRVLYRKFGIEPLPHNQKRARLVELALEGGIVATDGTGGEGTSAAEAAGHSAVAVPADAPAADEAPDQTPRSVPQIRGSSLLVAAGIVLGAIAVIVIAVLLLRGGSDSSDPAPTPAAYMATLERSCRQAVTQGETYREATRVNRAISYFKTFDFVVQGGLQSTPPPAGENLGLAQFTTGMVDAADLNQAVAAAPANAASRGLASISAHLTIAAGKVQAGAIKYELSGDCRELGSLAGESAQNAAGPP